MRVFVIAEAGTSHESDFDRACALIHAAKAAGADACKFQWWSDLDRLCVRRPSAGSLAPYQMPRAWLEPLAALCAAESIEFMCTVYAQEDLAAVAPYLQRLKIASLESRDEPFVYACLALDKPIVASLPPAALSTWWHYLQRGFPITLLHCIPIYPCSLETADLARIRRDRLDGWSDHTGHVLAGAVAVGAGARTVEVHIRLEDTSLGHPDFAVSHPPEGLTTYITYLRQADRMIGP